MKNKPVISIAVILAFVTPYVSIASGLVVAWLFVHLHILGIFHVNKSAVAETIAGAVVFAVTAGLHYAAAHFHWLPVVLQNLSRRDAPMATGTGTAGGPVSSGTTLAPSGVAPEAPRGAAPTSVSRTTP